MHLALYRKYRPASFADVSGQEVIVRTLLNAVDKDMVSHAYLFCGPRGTGKTSIAKIFASLVNCEKPIAGKPCGKCLYCKQQDAELDVVEIDAASNNGVDEIRELRSNTNLMPGVGRFKVYIIDEVHMLSTSAFNALLKTLEEPPAHVIFILATTEVHKIPLTILSRCQRFDFKRINENEIGKRVKQIAKKEKIKISDEAIEKIAEVADGAMRDAISLLDQLAATNEAVELSQVLLTLGISDENQIKNIIYKLEGGNLNDIKKVFKSIQKDQLDYSYLVTELIKYYQNELLANSKDDILSKILMLDDLYTSLKKSSLKQIVFETGILRIYLKLIESPQEEKVEEIPEPVIVPEVAEIENVDSIFEQRIDNILTKAEKTVLEKYKKLFKKNAPLFLENDIAALVDGEVVIASDDGVILLFDYSSQVELVTLNILEIEDKLKHVIKNKIYIVPVVPEELDRIKKRYIDAKKGKVKLIYRAEGINIEQAIATDAKNEISDLFEDIVEKEKI